MALRNKELEEKLMYRLWLLERDIDYIAPTPLRHAMSEQLVNMRKTLTEYEEVSDGTA